ncbi:hypothetical protein DPMN_088627 [Dreissena polymorpha]|uniref:Uncharacterized protein n=1 Tax=Dreissena polymorpha TaxID=45954 RepID=A0A9D4KW69_DREPO|nr:hypothetical protein DPMN_088627 [Dreissena polymorpha]
MQANPGSCTHVPGEKAKRPQNTLLPTRILVILRSDRLTNDDVMRRAVNSGMTTRLHQRRARWLGHMRRMDNERISKEALYGELP